MLKHTDTGSQSNKPSVAGGSVTALGLNQLITLLDKRGQLIRQEALLKGSETRRLVHTGILGESNSIRALTLLIRRR